MSATVAARNAANAQNSTGPVTAEGKTRSAQNALRHGLTSNRVVLAHENVEEYEALKQSFFETHRPATEREEGLITRMAECWWRLARALRVESEFLQQRADAITEANPDLAGDAALALMFTDPAQSKGYRLFLRYLTNAQNSYRQACAEFEKVRKERLAREHEACMLEMMYASAAAGRVEEPAAGSGAPDLTGSGFVSHTNFAPSEMRAADTSWQRKSAA